MELLVANGTYQNYDFHYRCPEIGKVLHFHIPAGHQAKLPPGDMNETQIASVTRQLEAIGAVSVSEVGRIHVPRALVFSVNRPVSENKLNEHREKNADAQQNVSDQQVENAGLGSFPTDQRTAAQTVSTTLEVRELTPTDREEAAKGGVDARITVSKRADAREPRRKTK